MDISSRVMTVIIVMKTRNKTTVATPTDIPGNLIFRAPKTGNFNIVCEVLSFRISDYILVG